ncbi:hypothetical protein [Pasteuria penetrans]|uniref:hypothetical protein n=1 Tax=Pasteuria penetrans TaxID=86005 RepID=UPI000FB225A5|nr:hypothetical protein [Pasteuria penetrans]
MNWIIPTGIHFRVVLQIVPGKCPDFVLLCSSRCRCKGVLFAFLLNYESQNRSDVYEKIKGHKVRDRGYSDLTQFLMGIIDVDSSFYRMDSIFISGCIRKLSRNRLIFLMIIRIGRSVRWLNLPFLSLGILGLNS